MGKRQRPFRGAEGIPDYICPLFWQHGEDAAVLEEEIERMHQTGIMSFIVESRPHPDFLSFGWWRDLDVIIAAAKERGMNVWIFDDNAYPSGIAAGKIKALYPEMTKRYMAQDHLDVIGPQKGASFFIDPWLKEGESLIRVIAAKRAGELEELDQDSMVDITGSIQDGRLYWDLPEGQWRIFIIKKTRFGAEDHTIDYVNPISQEAVATYIDVIYEEHYKRYKEEFGRTIEGFFVDEPRFGSKDVYEHTIGERGLVYPYTEGLLDLLSAELGKDFAMYLPFLWNSDSACSRDVHYAYMNVVSKLFGECFIGQMGSWCDTHGVKLIGHLVEDNGAHARLGYGPGHFFRGIKGFHASGLDVVYQVSPEYMSGRHSTPFGYLNSEFYYWGVAKLASSAAHIDEEKDGMTVCELFGANGWQFGLKMMKWLTDHVCVRGINYLIPHAFSPKFPDDDCPPHFYARGQNPQWKYFDRWSHYANRLCQMLTGGKHVASAAVLYHAEAEWSGAYMPFEKVVRSLHENQIDCDIVPVDLINDRERAVVRDGRLCINGETYPVLIIPYSEAVGKAFGRSVLELADTGLRVLFVDGYPSRVCYEGANREVQDLMAQHAGISVVELEKLPERMMEMGCYDILVDKTDKYLRFYHYRKDGQNLYYFVNESKYEDVEAEVEVTAGGSGAFCWYDVMADEWYSAEGIRKDGKFVSHLKLTPFQSIMLIEGRKNAEQENAAQKEALKRMPGELADSGLDLAEGWMIRAEDGAEGCEVLADMHTLQNLAVPDILPKYVGTLRYDCEFCYTRPDGEDGKRIYLDLGEVYEISDVRLNGKEIGSKICPPHIYEVTDVLKEKNEITIDVTNTLAKELGENYFDRARPQEPTGLLGPVRILEEKN